MGELGARELRAFDLVSTELYASVSSDNRLRIWNTATGQLRQQYVEPKHLAKQYTCIAWHRPASKAKRSSSGTAMPSSMGFIALGTDKGTVSVWDLKRGAVAHDLGKDEGLPGVTSVAFSLDGKSLYSASSGKDIIEWSLETGEVSRKLKGFKHGSTQICLHPLGKILAVASSSIRLLDLATGKRERKLSAGHAGAVRQLTFSADGRYLASSAVSARFANVFDLAGEDLTSEPVATLGFAAAPTFLALHAAAGASFPSSSSGRQGMREGEGDQLTVVGGFDTGGVCVLRTRRRSDGQDGDVSKLDIRGAASGDAVTSTSPPALHACLSADRPSSALILATGSSASPRFTEVVFEDDSGALLSTSSAVIDGSRNGAKSEQDVTVGLVGAKAGPAHVVGPGELGIRGVEQDNVSVEDGGEGDDGHGKVKGRKGEVEVDGDGRVLKRLKASESEEDGVGEESRMTIAERLEALSEAIDEEEGRRASGMGAARGGGVLAAVGQAEGEQPRAESLSTVLIQALQSGDESLLEQCFAVGEQGVIKATVERLPSSKVLPFLLRVVAKLEKRPNRAATLGRWIRALLSCHLGYLVSVPELPDKLALLHQLIDRRVASFPKLLQLHGRLDLLLARARAGAGVGSSGGERAMDKPEAVYREDEDEENEDDSEESQGSDAESDDEEEDEDEEDMDQDDENDDE